MARSGACDGSEVHEDHIDFLRHTRRLPGKDFVKVRLAPEREISPASEEGERVVFHSHCLRGLGLSASSFFRSLLQQAAGAAGPECRFLPNQAESDVDDPNLGAAALEDDAEGGGGEAGGSGFRASLEDWPDDNAGEVVPRRQPGSDQQGASSSAAPAARGGAHKRRATPSLFGSRPKKPRGSAAATKRDEAAAKAIRFRKVVKEPQLVSAAPLSPEKSAAGSIVGSAETSATTRRIDPAADLREATERNAWEVREEQEAARLEKAEVERAEAAALKKLAEAEAAIAAKKQAKEAARHQSDYHNLRVAAFNSNVQELETNATLQQQQQGEANTTLRAKEVECGKLAEEHDRLVAQLADQAELLKKPIRPLKLTAKDGGRKVRRLLPTPPDP
nr:uncharacterized protein LOC120975993 [Aegilops tauschii subsp. strangulata]